RAGNVNCSSDVRPVGGGLRDGARLAMRASVRVRSILLVVAVTAGCRLPCFVKPFLDGDEAIYASIAALLDAGGHLYGEGGVDNKPPGIFWTYAAVFRLFGRFHLHAVHALALVCVLGTAGLLALAARRAGGSHRAAFWP